MLSVRWECAPWSKRVCVPLSFDRPLRRVIRARSARNRIMRKIRMGCGGFCVVVFTRWVKGFSSADRDHWVRSTVPGYIYPHHRQRRACMGPRGYRRRYIATISFSSIPASQSVCQRHIGLMSESSFCTRDQHWLDVSDADDWISAIGHPTHTLRTHRASCLYYSTMFTHSNYKLFYKTMRMNNEGHIICATSSLCGWFTRSHEGNNYTYIHILEKHVSQRWSHTTTLYARASHYICGVCLVRCQLTVARRWRSEIPWKLSARITATL